MPILNLEWFLQHCSVSVPHIFLIPFLQMNAANKTPSTSWNSLHSEPIQRILCGYGQISLASHFTSTFPRLYNIMCICRDGSMRRQKLLEIRFDLNGQTTNGAPTHCVISNRTKSFEAIVWVGYSLADNLYRGTYSDVMIQLNKPSDCMCLCVCVCISISTSSCKASCECLPIRTMCQIWHTFQLVFEIGVCCVLENYGWVGVYVLALILPSRNPFPIMKHTIMVRHHILVSRSNKAWQAVALIAVAHIF